MENSKNMEIELDDELTAYIIVKSILSLIYSDDINEDLAYENELLPIYSELTLEILCSVLDSYKHFIDESTKENIYTLVMKFRDYANKLSKEEKETYYMLVNDVLSALNKCDCTQMMQLIYLELDKREYTKKMMLDVASDYEKAIRLTKESFMNDLILLLNHTKLITEEEFKEDLEIYTTLDPDYIASMNAILKEHPAIFNDKTFYERTMMVCNLIGDKLKYAKRKDFQFISFKDMKKMYSNYKKKIYEL